MKLRAVPRNREAHRRLTVHWRGWPSVAILPIAALTISLPASSAPAKGNPRDPYTAIDGAVIVRLPVEKECWLLKGSNNSLFGVSQASDGQRGLIITQRDRIPVSAVTLSVGLWRTLTEEPDVSWDIRFENYGTTNGQEFAYVGHITENQLELFLQTYIVTYSAFFRVGERTSYFNEAHAINFTDRSLQTLSACASTFA